MNISGIRPNVGIYTSNYIRPAQEATPVVTEQKVESAPASEAQVEERERPSYNAADYAKDYEPGKSYEMKGVKSDLRSYDVQKAINDMQKDQMLQQYQYFVGESLMNAGSNASVTRAVENFDL